MFDEQNQNTDAPKNLPTEPVDMFAGVEKNDNAASPPSIPDALSAGLLKKKDEVKTMPGLPASLSSDEGTTGVLQNYKMSAPILGKVLLFLVAFVLLGGLAYGGWWIFYGSKNKPAQLPVVPTEQSSQNQPDQTVNTSTNIPAQINNDQILFGEAVDNDKDGLDDVREKEIGTDSQKIDSDSDGLNDGDEVIVFKTSPLISDTDGDGLSDGDEALIWHSNPLNPDSDGDSYQDGEEIRNGYSPVGPGKLFTSPATNTPSSASADWTKKYTNTTNKGLLALQFLKDFREKQPVPSTTVRTMNYGGGLTAASRVEPFYHTSLDSCVKSTGGEDSPGQQVIQIYSVDKNLNDGKTHSVFLSFIENLDPPGNTDGRWLPVLYGPYEGKTLEIANSFADLKCV